MIRVLQVVHGMNRRGIETFLMNVYRKIDRSKVQFDFMLNTDQECDYSAEIRALGGRIFFVPPRNQGVLKNRKALAGFFQAHQEYSVIHQHLSSLSYVEPLKIAQKHGVLVRIVHSHSTKEGGSSFHNCLHFWNKFSVKSYATDYFACSDLAAKWLYGKKQYHSGEFKIINNGIETGLFVFNPEMRTQLRRELGVEDNFVVGHVGCFVYPKNHDFLIDIFKQVHNHNMAAVLLLVGEGELRGQLEGKIATLGLQDSVILTGSRSDIPNLLQAMDVVVMPSYHEGLPVTLIEAQAAGLSCLVSDRITKNVKVTELLETINLDQGAVYWAERVNRKSGKGGRVNTLRQIIESGFDVKEVAEHLQNYYLERLKEKCQSKGIQSTRV